jgi:pimeloyl-ACP methyl ester carboxylesterase
LASAEPFTIAIADADLDDLRARLGNTRWAHDLANDDWRYGVERGWLEEMVRYWREDYDWRAVEAEINRVPHFIADIDGQPIHFAHIRGKGPNPIPLLLVHGWPWTFHDFFGLIGPLTDPAAHGGDPSDSFDLVIPSLPGFGFSMPLERAGLDLPAHVALFAKLMGEVLGYERYAIGGGDWGAAITSLMAHAHPENVIGLFSSIPFFPGLDIAGIAPGDFADDEQWMVEQRAESGPTMVSHVAVQAADPQTLAYALVDSPVGTAAWLWERRRAWSDCGGDLFSVHSRDWLCTLASIYWLTRSIGTSLRIYYEHLNGGVQALAPLHDRRPAIEVPCGYAIAPRELMLFPRRLVEEGTNLRHWEQLPQGGHFSFSEQPEMMAERLTRFFRPLREQA